jgi:hypothetical protein
MTYSNLLGTVLVTHEVDDQTLDISFDESDYSFDSMQRWTAGRCEDGGVL